MKAWKKRKMSSRFFYGMSFISFIVFLLMILIMLLVVYQEMSQNYRKLTRTSMENIDVVFSDRLRETLNKAESWYSLPQGMLCRTDESWMPVDDPMFVKQLRDELVISSYIHSIYFLNASGNVVLHIGDNRLFSENLDRHLPIRISQVQGTSSNFSWIVSNRYDGKPDIELLTVFYQETFNDNSQYFGTVLVNLDRQQLSKSIFSSLNENTEYYILDKNGIVVLSSIADRCGEDWSEKSYISDLLSGRDGNCNSTRDTIDINQEQYELTYMASGVRGYYIVACAENTGILNTLQKYNMHFLVTAFGIAAVIIGSSYLLSKWFYRPIDRMVSKVRQTDYIEENDSNVEEMQLLENVFERLSGHVSMLKHKSDRDAFIKGFLGNNWNADMQSILLSNDIIRRGHGYYVILVYLAPDDQKQDKQDLNIVESVYGSLLEQCGKCTFMGLNENSFMILESEEKALSEDNLLQVLQNAAKLSTDLYQRGVYVLVSGYVPDGREPFAISYEQLDATLRLRAVLEDCGVTVYGTTVDYKCIESALENMLSAVKNRKKEEYTESLTRYLKEAVHMNEQSFTVQTAEFAEKIYEMQGYITFSEQKESNICRYIGELKAITKRSELEEWFWKLYDNANRQMEKMQKHSASDAMDKIVNYIRNDYSNPDMNLDMLAQQLGISASYCGKKFKELTGMSVTDYITKTRIEKARELLIKEPEKEIAMVAMEVGFRSQGYFATRFREYYGVSPSKFRDFNLAEKLEGED